MSWSEEARRQATTEAARLNENVIAVIEECLAQDPRPAYQAHDPEREYGVRLWDLNIRWRYPSDQSIVITEVSPLA